MKPLSHLTQLLLLPLIMTITTAVEFAPIFNASINSKTVQMDCKYLNKDICCSALEEEPLRESPDLGVSMEMISKIQQTGSCVTTKEYVPSPYETRHLLKAKEISQFRHQKRLNATLDFMFRPEEIEASQRWLERVKVRMKPRGGSRRRKDASHRGGDHLHGQVADRGKRSLGEVLDQVMHHPVHPDDDEYMSKFIVNKTCRGVEQSGEVSSKQWVEWIEPLSVHARHPYGQ